MIHTFTSNRLTQRKRGQFSILTMMDDLLEEEQREEPKLEKELIFTRGPMEPEERQTMLNKSSKDRTWSAVPDALLGVIS